MHACVHMSHQYYIMHNSESNLFGASNCNIPIPQVMQFGRIDSNAYTLDFQYPFSAIQAFAVALANVTQRLK